ncbi:hypothetical protein D3C85_1096530 [compost metagenome]
MSVWNQRMPRLSKLMPSGLANWLSSVRPERLMSAVPAALAPNTKMSQLKLN